MRAFGLGMTVFWFPLAVLLNGYSMTALLIVMGFAGNHEVAASIGLVQGASAATFFVFSANARNLILADGTELVASRMLQIRLVLMLPLAYVVYFLSVTLADIAPTLALVLILRRAVEWIGDIGLALQERLDQRGHAQFVILMEAFGFLLCLTLSLGFDVEFATSAIPWALVPLISIFRARLSLKTSELFTIYSAIPHIGSTAIIGVSVYMFRIMVVVLAGKAGAGELFTAFAIGGTVPIIMGQILAPTLLRRFGPSVMQSRIMAASAIVMLMVGGGIATLAIALTDVTLNLTLWLAIGFSIAGGAIMIVAALLRANFIHSHREDRDVFGPDLLSNILLVLCVPIFYFTLGVKSMSGLYLLSACLNLVYIWGAVRRKRVGSTRLHSIFFVLGTLLVVPVFFQFEGGLFRDPSMLFNMSGQLLDVPTPLSIFALFGGIAILGNYAAAKRSLALVFFAMIFCMASVLRINNDSIQAAEKLVLLSQFLFPMFGLVLGEMFGVYKNEPIFERTALGVLLLILPAQLAATWIEGRTHAGIFVFIFSIYQHNQYFPAIVAALATMASFALWGLSESTRLAVGVMIPIVLLYLVESGSIRAIFAGVIGITASCVFYWRYQQSRWYLLMVIVIGMLIAAIYAFQSDSSLNSPRFQWSMVEASSADLLNSATHRFSQFEHWRLYSAGVIESPQAFVFGHVTRPDGIDFPHAKNYWFDAVYSFGIFGILPLLVLLVMSIRLFWQRRREIWSTPVLLGSLIGGGYLILVEGIFDIGMRQIYPGIITFFILGILIARLRRADV